jgi:hypothetical protein
MVLSLSLWFTQVIANLSRFDLEFVEIISEQLIQGPKHICFGWLI